MPDVTNSPHVEDLETPICSFGLDVDDRNNRGVRSVAIASSDSDQAESATFFSPWMASQFSVRKVAQASGLFLLAATLVFAVADHQGLLTFGATHGKTTLSDSGAIAKAHEAKGTKVNASHTHKTKGKEAEKEECSNAVPGDPCYGAVLWHKWIGLIQQPYAYDGNLTRESDRHNIQSWLHEKGRSGCPRPCKESIAYPIPKVAHPGGPQIYCFSVARTGPEMDSMFMQRQTGTGIFACNGYDVYSDHEIDIDGYKTKLIPSTAPGVSVDRTAANSQVFMKTWMYILGSHWWYKYDFLAKVDPDAILFPERLRGHVAAHVGQNVFFLNCAVHAPAMYGAVEVFAKSALGAYQAAHGRCEQSLPFWSWGEDRFMQECLKMLGVIPIPDYTENVRDARCWGSDCGNKGAVAFHPFKAVNGWYRCYLASQ